MNRLATGTGTIRKERWVSPKIGNSKITKLKIKGHFKSVVKDIEIVPSSIEILGSLGNNLSNLATETYNKKSGV